ncbi:sensor histidine kinase [Fusibacter ferrireducens]|uniref:Sensor histidine kinase n=1 Tax=Fusibacter ferrireducens TaxID=2785058 RepID=A0ABR9ZXN1_9FIRM|nr:sensor histidine kinase [Fusibacter ferrireducens]MBF4695215.1 sensor histidine kinase [Fusibacter ferrireducens]
MKKRGWIVLAVLIWINLVVSFGDTTAQNLEFEKAEIIELSEGWTYVDAFWIAPDALDLIEGETDYSLDRLSENNSKNRSRGTLCKKFTIPRPLVGNPIVINNTLFNGKFTLYINEMPYEKSLLISKYQRVKEGYLFIPNNVDITMVIQFEQDLNQISSGSSLYLGPLEAYEKHQYFVWISNSIILAVAIVFLIYLIWQRLSSPIRIKGYLFEVVILAFILDFIISEMTHTLTFAHFEVIRIQLFLFTFISTVAATYGLEISDRFMPFVKEFGKIYLILFAAGVTVMPIQYLNIIWYGHLLLTLVYVILSDRHKMQWKITLIFVYFLIMAYFNLSGILTSNLYMLPVLIIMIYKSFFRVAKNEFSQNEVDTISLKEAYGTDKTEVQFKEMLNTIEEGVAIVMSDLYVDHVYNETLQVLLDVDIKHKKITDLIYQEDFDNKLYVETILTRYFEAETENDKRLYLDLLSSKVTINGRILSIKYKTAKDPKYLVVVLEDETEIQKIIDEKVLLQKKVDVILEITRNQSEFKQLYQEFLQFLHQDIEYGMEKNTTIIQRITSILLRLDYFEKAFVKFGLENTTEALQKSIEALNTMKKEGSFDRVDDMKRYLESFGLNECLSMDVEWLEGAFDEDIMKQEHLIMVDESDFIELEKKLMALPEHEQLLELVLKMKHAQNQKLIRKYDQYIAELARKLGKKINPIVLEGYENILDNANFNGILKSMFHLIDNALIHGIEKPSDRFGKNKSEFGTIKIQFKNLETFIEVIFEDDGQGVDYNGIKEVLYQQKKVPFETLILLDSEALSDYLFEEGVTTDAENHLGVGLAQLKKEVELQNGRIKIESSLNQFTRVVIRLNE